MSVRLKGINKLEKQLKKMSNGAKELKRTNNVSFDELFTPKFMLKHSKFSSFDELLNAGNFHVETSKDFETIPDDVFNPHVAKYTDFSNWEDMLGAATEEYVLKKLGL